LRADLPEDGNRTTFKTIQINIMDEVQNNNLRETFSLDFNSKGKLQN
jgi:hypothetical protein